MRAKRRYCRLSSLQQQARKPVVPAKRSNPGQGARSGTLRVPGAKDGKAVVPLAGEITLTLALSRQGRGDLASSSFASEGFLATYSNESPMLACEHHQA